MCKQESNVKSFVSHIDQEIMEAIEKWATGEFRSTNGQIQYLLDQALRKADRIKKEQENRPRCAPTKRDKEYNTKFCLVTSSIQVVTRLFVL